MRAIEPGERVRLEDPAEAFEVALGMLAGAIPREVEQCRRRVAPAEGPVVTHVPALATPCGDARCRIGLPGGLQSPASTPLHSVELQFTGFHEGARRPSTPGTCNSAYPRVVPFTRIDCRDSSIPRLPRLGSRVRIPSPAPNFRRRFHEGKQRLRARLDGDPEPIVAASENIGLLAGYKSAWPLTFRR